MSHAVARAGVAVFSCKQVLSGAAVDPARGDHGGSDPVPKQYCELLRGAHKSGSSEDSLRALVLRELRCSPPVGIPIYHDRNTVIYLTFHERRDRPLQLGDLQRAPRVVLERIKPRLGAMYPATCGQGMRV